METGLYDGLKIIDTDTHRARPLTSGPRVPRRSTPTSCRRCGRTIRAAKAGSSRASRRGRWGSTGFGS